MTKPDEIAWEEVALLPDCAFAALGSPRLADDAGWLSHQLPYLRVRRSGYGMIYGLAECDGLPIEVGSIAGQAVAIRLEFTNDVADLEAAREGAWTPLGRLRLDESGVIALDKKHQHVEGWHHQVPLPAGWYAAEVFATEDDHVGIRLRAEDALRLRSTEA